MISAARILAVWLTPAAWLALPALVLEGGPDGVWVGLLLLVVPEALLPAQTELPLPPVLLLVLKGRRLLVPAQLPLRPMVLLLQVQTQLPLQVLLRLVLLLPARLYRMRSKAKYFSIDYF